MKKTRFFYVFLLSFAIFSTIFIPRLNDTNFVSAVSFTSAKGMCVLEKDSKRVIFEKNMNVKMPMASTTKIMTAITVIQNCNDIDEVIQVDDSAIGVEGTSIYLRSGELVSVRDLLYGLMLRSGNDAATALACYVGGDVSGFAKLMNDLASKIGAKNSHFMNPHGLHHEDHYTTAYDLSLITAYALNNPIFKEIVSTKSYVIDETNISDKRYLSNKNKLLSSLDGCCGVKTGFTKAAGRCLVSACERDNATYVCTVLNCGPMFEESSELLNNCFNNFKNIKIIDKNKEIYNEYFIDEKFGKLFLYTDEDFYYPLKNNEIEKIKIKYNIQLNNAKEGENVGEIRIFFENDLIKTLKLYTMNKIDKLIDANSLQISDILWEEKVNEN